MPKTYSQYHQGHSPNALHSRQRSWGTTTHQSPSTKRIWVRKDDGPPTTLNVAPHDIVDDLKLAITHKYPTTLARFFDPADIQIHLRVPDEPTKKHKAKQSSLNRIAQESDEVNGNSTTGLGSRLPSLPAASTFGGSIIVLEPDQVVWDILDEFFGGSMGMNEALTIVATPRHESMPYGFLEFPERANLRSMEYRQGSMENNQFGMLPIRGTSPTTVPTGNYHHPKPQHAFQTASLTKNTSVSPPFAQRLSPLNGIASVHKRSQSNPPLLPSMANVNQIKGNNQAVLLLPKNFTLGEQNPLKRYSLDGDMVPREEFKASHSKSLSDGNNVTNIGLHPESNGSSPNDETTGTETPPQVPPAPQSGEVSRSSSGSRKASGETKPKSEITEPATRKKSDSISKARDAKPVSTFERVLPSLLVLVVEDNAINQAILGAFLRKHKIRYQIAKNGQEAIDKWRKGGFHLVLMDIQLPVKSGIEATKEIRHLEKVNRIGVFAQQEFSKLNGPENLREDERLDLNVFRSPVIIVALTASSNSSVDKKNALTAGCNDFLTKPVNLVWLQNKITEWGCMQALIDFDGWKGKRGNKSEPVKATPKREALPKVEPEKPSLAS